MKAWWNISRLLKSSSLSLREQYVVMMGGVISLVLLLIIFVWIPFTAHVQKLEQQVKYQRDLLTWMQSTAKAIEILQQPKSEDALASSQDLLSRIDQTIKTSPLHENLVQLAQTDQKKVKIKFLNVNFDNLIEWLTALWKADNIQVDELTINLMSSGIVNADITLKLA